MIDVRAEIAELDSMRERVQRVFPAYISHIRFPRYKNIAPGTRIDFTFPVTALVGANGSGKTSVLNALYGAPIRKSTGEFWFSTQVDPIEEGEGSPNRFIYGHYNRSYRSIVETRKARVRKFRNGRDDPNYWEPTKEAPGDGMVVPTIPDGEKLDGRSLDRWNPVRKPVLYINFRKELSAFDKYFYFGKDPVAPASRVEKGDLSAESTRAQKVSRRIQSKMDRVRHDSILLSRVVDSGDTSVLFRKRKVATENRLLTGEELAAVSFVLGRNYSEARWIRHRLFKVDGGLSILFKTEHGRYSEAFAGSGEVAVTSCVVQVLSAAKGTLLLLDEPEVSLHPGAQERLLAFLAQVAKRRQIQVVFSTHSPHMIAALPDDAIKSFHQLSNGEFSVIPSTHPYAAFRRLGAVDGRGVLVLVEDRLAKAVVRQAISTIPDEAIRQLFQVEYPTGGASAILAARIPVLMESSNPVLVLLDGDQKKVDSFIVPSDIPTSQDADLENIIRSQVGLTPFFAIDGGSSGGNRAQKIAAQRKYLDWIGMHLRYLPCSSPEELVLHAAGKLEPPQTGNASHCKSRLQELATENLGIPATGEQTDTFADFLLGNHRSDSIFLEQIADTLTGFLAGLQRP